MLTTSMYLFQVKTQTHTNVHRDFAREYEISTDRSSEITFMLITSGCDGDAKGYHLTYKVTIRRVMDQECKYMHYLINFVMWDQGF